MNKTWNKSSFCATNGCVEVRADGDGVQVRDSKQGANGPVLDFTAAEWTAFTEGVRAGELTL